VLERERDGERRGEDDRERERERERERGWWKKVSERARDRLYCMYVWLKAWGVMLLTCVNLFSFIV